MTLEEALPCTCPGRFLGGEAHMAHCPARRRSAVAPLIAADQARIAELEAVLIEIRDFTNDVPDDHPLSHVHGIARAALTCKTCGGTKRAPDETERGPTDFDPSYLVPCPTCGGSDE